MTRWILTLLFTLVSLSATTFDLPAERKFDWSNYAGVVGGDAAASWPEGARVTSSDVDTNGVSDAFQVILTKLNAMPDYTYLQLPEGTLALKNNPVSWSWLFSKKEVRGAGMNKTELVYYQNTSGYWVYGPSVYRTQQIYSSNPSISIFKGATTLSVLPDANTSALAVGKFIFVDSLQDGDPNDPSSTNSTRLNNFLINAQGVEGNWGTSAGTTSGQGSYRMMSQVLKIVGINSSTQLVYIPPISITRTNVSALGTNLSPRVFFRDNDMTTYHDFGFRDLSMDFANTGIPDGSGGYGSFQIQGVNNWWFINCEFKNWYRTMIFARLAPFGTIAHCYFHNSTGLISSTGYGIELQYGADNVRVEDNIFTFVRTPIIQEGGVGNVFLYNYMDHFTNYVNAPYNDHALQKGPSTHANWPHDCLWEGNYGGRFGGDDTHGNSGFQTYFRNWMSGYPGPYAASAMTEYNWAFTLNRCDLFYSAVNNVMGFPGRTVNARESLYPDNTRDAARRYLWDIGHASDGPSDAYQDGTGVHYGIRLDKLSFYGDTNVYMASIADGRLIRQGNWEFPSATTYNEPEYGSMTYSNSMFYASTPNYWTNWGTPTTNYPAFGSDLPTKTNTIPAMDRYNNHILQGDFAFNSAPTCSYSLSSSSATYTASPGSGSVTVTTTAGCDWTAVANDSWLHVTSGSPGNTSGPVAYTVDANTGVTRTGTFTIAGQTFTVTQAGLTTTQRTQTEGRIATEGRVIFQ